MVLEGPAPTENHSDERRSPAYRPLVKPPSLFFLPNPNTKKFFSAAVAAIDEAALKGKRLNGALVFALVVLAADMTIVRYFSPPRRAQFPGNPRVITVLRGILRPAVAPRMLDYSTKRPASLLRSKAPHGERIAA